MIRNITPEDVRQELRTALGSATFSRGGELLKAGKLLQYLVTVELDGKSPNARELRKPFPHLEVDLNRLRHCLRKYYSDAGEGHGNPVKISIAGRGHEILIEPSSPGDRGVSAGANVEIPFERFKRFLIAMCWERDLGTDSKDNAIREWFGRPESARIARFLQRMPHPHRHAVFSLDQITFENFIDRLSNSMIRYSEMRSLIGLFRIDRLFLDSVLSQEQEDPDYLTLNLRSEFFDVGDKTDSYGKDVQYSLPRSKLRGTDVAFVQLKLGKNGHSTTHEHPGNELLLVLEGQVEVRFEHSGVRTILNPGDYIHFYAEQAHGAWSLGAESRLFIIRFNQMGLEGTRQYMRREVEGMLNQRGPRTGLSSLTMRWLLQATSRPSTTKDNELQDKVGLARLLSALRKTQGLTRDVLARRTRLQGAHLERFEEKLEKLEQARADLNRNELKLLATAYGAEQLLYQNFLLPAIPNVVVVRSKKRHGDDDDMVPIDDTQLPSGVVYNLPCRNLAFSDIAITKVVLSPNSSTPWNWHSGSELLIALRGAARVEYRRGPTFTISAAKEEMAHYNSVEEHRVTGISPGYSELLVLRLYCDGHWTWRGIGADAPDSLSV